MNRPEAEPKPFFWIDLKKAPTCTTPPNQDRFEHCTGQMVIDITVHSDYLYVGSGLIELEGESAYHSFVRSKNRPVIPGTSIKGAIRSIVEAISNSCVSQAERHKTPKSHQRCQKSSGLCSACRLFGATSYRGRVHFADARLIDSLLPDGRFGEVRTDLVKIAHLWPPKLIKGRKFYQNKQFQRLKNNKPERNHHFIETVPTKTVFRTTFFFENVSEAELGLLICAMGLGKHQTEEEIAVQFPIKLGGAKPRCLGAVNFVPKELRLVTPAASNRLFAALAKGGEKVDLHLMLLNWLAKGELLDQVAWKQFKKEAQILEELCPKEWY